MIATDWQLQEGSEHVWTVPEGWGQGRAVFGGLVAGAAVRLSMAHVTRPVRTVQAQFIAPVRPGLLRAQFEKVREGKSVSLTRVALSQEDRSVADFLFTHIETRPDSVELAFRNAPSWEPPETLVQMPYLAGVTPEFTQHFDYRFAHGAMPYQGAERAHYGGYIRALNEPGDEVADTLALLDAWPCPTLSVVPRPVAASTVTWTVHLFGSGDSGFHAFDYRTEYASVGFSTSVAALWAADGRALAYSEQTVAVFD